MATKKSTKRAASKKTSSKKSSNKSPQKRSSAKKRSAKKTPAKKRAARRVLAITAGVAAAAVAAGVALTKAVACTIKNRGDVSRLVLTFVRSLGFTSAVEASDFTSDIVVSSNARRAWATGILDAVSAKGCEAGTFGPDDCSNAAKVGDIVDALAGALHV